MGIQKILTAKSFGHENLSNLSTLNTISGIPVCNLAVFVLKIAIV